MGRRLAAKSVTNLPIAIREIEQSLNSTVNSVTNLVPKDTTDKDAPAILVKNRNRRLKKKIKERKFKVGDLVRISESGGVFKKTSEAAFSKTIYKIESIKETTPKSYILTNFETGAKLRGSVTHHQIVKA